jgi:hypothetical protein
VEFESVVITDDRQRWLAAGSPSVPTLVIDGTAHVLQHPGQAGTLLGLETPPGLRDAWQVAWDLDAVVEAWLELVTTTPWEALVEPLPRLRRTALALAVDTMIGVAALPGAFTSGWFHWPGNPRTGETGDEAVVAYEEAILSEISGRADLLAFARPVADAWRTFLLDHDEALRGEPDRPVRAPRGDLPWVSLLEAQRLHAAGHYRQATTFVGSLGHGVPSLDLASLSDLKLSAVVY